jgi:hypothetical protein
VAYQERRANRRRATSVDCVECGISSGLYWVGWRASRTDDPELAEDPQLAFYCPACALREFGSGRGPRSNA